MRSLCQSINKSPLSNGARHNYLVSQPLQASDRGHAEWRVSGTVIVVTAFSLDEFKEKAVTEGFAIDVQELTLANAIVQDMSGFKPGDKVTVQLETSR